MVRYFVMLSEFFVFNLPYLIPDFSEALADPRAFLSKQEKHAQQLKMLGIDETEMNNQKIIETKVNGATSNGSHQHHHKPAVASSSLPAKSHIAGLMSRKSTKEFEELEEVSQDYITGLLE